MANAVKPTLQARDLDPTGANVFTAGIRGRLSLSIFEQVLNPGIRIGVIFRHPADYETDQWWQSSDRAKGLIAEATSLIYETFVASHADSTSAASGSVQKADPER